MEHTLYESEHDAFRDAVRSFLAKHVEPYHAEWEKAGIVDRTVWVEAGKQGLLGTDVPEEYGGGGVKDFRYNCVVAEEVVRVGGSGVGFTLHNDVVAPYLLKLGTDEQKARTLSRNASCSGSYRDRCMVRHANRGSQPAGRVPP